MLVTIGIFYMCKVTTMGVGNHTFRYDSMRFDTICFHHLLTLHELGKLLVVVPAEIAAGGFHDARQLVLSGATISPRLAIIPLISFHERSGYINFAPLTCAPRIGKSMGTMGSCMSFDACEGKSATFLRPRPRFGIFGAVVLLMSHFIFFLSVKD